MKFPVIAAVALLVPLLAGRDAVAATCAGAEKNDGICGNRALMALHQAVDAKPAAYQGKVYDRIR